MSDFQLDRLSVSALFDRNRSALSCAFDVLLACLVSCLAGLVLATGIYFDIWLFLLAFTVAGAHVGFLLLFDQSLLNKFHLGSCCRYRNKVWPSFIAEDF